MTSVDAVEYTYGQRRPLTVCVPTRWVVPVQLHESTTSGFNAA